MEAAMDSKDNPAPSSNTTSPSSLKRFPMPSPEEIAAHKKRADEGAQQLIDSLNRHLAEKRLKKQNSQE
jgi:hypothetical protein